MRAGADPDLKRFMRWRATRRWNLAAAAIGAAVVLVGGALAWRQREREGRLPTIEEVQRDLKIWPGPPRPDVLRGRPVRTVPFYDDMRFNAAPMFALALDEHRQVVAFHWSVQEQIDANGQYVTTPETLRQRAWLMTFLDRYVAALDLRSPAYGVPTTRGLLPGQIEWLKSCCFRRNGFEVEVSMHKSVPVGTRPEDVNSAGVIVIVRSRDW